MVHNYEQKMNKFNILNTKCGRPFINRVHIFVTLVMNKMLKTYERSVGDLTDRTFKDSTYGKTLLTKVDFL